MKLSGNITDAKGIGGAINRKASFSGTIQRASGGGGGGTDEVEWVTYGTTTSAEIEAAYQAGKIVCCEKDGYVYTLVWRDSATHHVFSLLYNRTRYSLICTSDTWSTSSVLLASAASLPAASSATPQDLGTAAAGSSTDYARADHVHKKPSAADIGAIPAPAAPSQSDLLIYNGHDWTAGAAPVEIFWCTYGGTVASEISAALYAGLLPAVVKDGVVYIYAYTDTYGDYYFGSTALKSLASQYCICSTGSVWNKSTVTLAQASDIPSAATAAPSDLAASAAVGSSSKYAKEDHVHKKPSAADVGAIPAPSSPSSGQFLVYNGSAWVAQTLSAWQASSY